MSSLSAVTGRRRQIQLRCPPTAATVDPATSRTVTLEKQYARRRAAAGRDHCSARAVHLSVPRVVAQLHDRFVEEPEPVRPASPGRSPATDASETTTATEPSQGTSQSYSPNGLVIGRADR